jgi:hypothetical protein
MSDPTNTTNNRVKKTQRPDKKPETEGTQSTPENTQQPNENEDAPQNQFVQMNDENRRVYASLFNNNFTFVSSEFGWTQTGKKIKDPKTGQEKDEIMMNKNKPGSISLKVQKNNINFEPLDLELTIMELRKDPYYQQRLAKNKEELKRRLELLKNIDSI